MSDVWTPEAYIKIISTDEELLGEALYKIRTGNERRFQVGEALRYAGKIQDNLKLLHQALNRATP